MIKNVIFYLYFYFEKNNNFPRQFLDILSLKTKISVSI